MHGYLGGLSFNAQILYYILMSSRIVSISWLLISLLCIEGTLSVQMVHASSWSPTLLVNTEAFQIIDDSNSTEDIVLQFGDDIAKSLTYERANGRFKLDDDLYIDGNLDVVGTLSGSALSVQSINGSASANSGDLLVGQGASAPVWRQPKGSLVWYIDGIVDTGPKQGAVVTMPFGFTVTDIDLHMKVAPTGADLEIDINEGGTSIYSTRPEVDATGTTEDGNEVISDATIAAGAEVTLDIDQVGSTFAGSGLTIMLHGIRKY